MLFSLPVLMLSGHALLFSRFQNPSKILQPPEKAGDDGNLVGTKNKEILSFQVALNETGSAGLGVSVKGKTTTNAQGVQDLGIFIKAVISGGAASKVRNNGKIEQKNYVFFVIILFFVGTKEKT